jgi:hypothetical protein
MMSEAGPHDFAVGVPLVSPSVGGHSDQVQTSSADGTGMLLVAGYWFGKGPVDHGEIQMTRSQRHLQRHDGVSVYHGVSD